MHNSMQTEYFEDIELDVVYTSRPYSITEEEIIRYASEWNPEPYHIDPQAAAENKIGRIFACGPHLVAICTKLTNEKRPRPASVAGLGWDTLRFTTPVFGGDVLKVDIKPVSRRLSKSKPDVGIVVYALRLYKQDGSDVLNYTVTTMVECRDKA